MTRQQYFKLLDLASKYPFTYSEVRQLWHLVNNIEHKRIFETMHAVLQDSMVMHISVFDSFCLTQQVRYLAGAK